MAQSGGSNRETLDYVFALLTDGERQLLICALAGNHPDRLRPLRPEVLRSLARTSTWYQPAGAPR